MVKLITNLDYESLFMTPNVMTILTKGVVHYKALTDKSVHWWYIMYRTLVMSYFTLKGQQWVQSRCRIENVIHYSLRYIKLHPQSLHAVERQIRNHLIGLNQ